MSLWLWSASLYRTDIDNEPVFPDGVYILQVCSGVRVAGHLKVTLFLPHSPHVKLICWHAMHGPPAWRPSPRWAPGAHRQPPPWTTGRTALKPVRVDTPPLSPAGRSASRPPAPSTLRRRAEWTEISTLGRDIKRWSETETGAGSRLQITAQECSSSSSSV